MSTQNKVISAIVIAVVIIGGGIVVYKKITHPVTNQPAQNTNTQTASKVLEQQPGQNQQVAPEGKLAAGFLPSLILESDAKIISSHSEDYPNQTHVYTTDFTTVHAVKDVYNDYLNYLNNNSYTVSNKNQTDKLANVYGKKGDAIINVSISKIDPKQPVQVTVSYTISQVK